MNKSEHTYVKHLEGNIATFEAAYTALNSLTDIMDDRIVEEIQQGTGDTPELRKLLESRNSIITTIAEVDVLLMEAKNDLTEYMNPSEESE